MAAPQPAPAKPARWASLDALRGLTIAGMILVNNPGDWQHTYHILDHAAWNGCTLADLVFPFFLFIMGASVALAIGGQQTRGIPQSQILLKAFRRGLTLFAIGFALNLLHDRHFATVRIPGVLQRIGLIYFLAVVFWLYIPRWGWLVYVLGTAALSWYLTYFSCTPHGHFWYDAVDGAVFGRHVYGPTAPRDAEGIFSDVTALSTALLGMWLGTWQRNGTAFVTRALATGAALAAFGYQLHLTIWPINKNLWTGSFVLWTAGLAMVIIALCFYLVEIKNRRAWLGPFLAAGTNPMIIYVGAEVGAWLLGRKVFPGDMNVRKLTLPILQTIFVNPYWASLAWALLLVTFWLWIGVLLKRRGILVKI